MLGSSTEGGAVNVVHRMVIQVGEPSTDHLPGCLRPCHHVILGSSPGKHSGLSHGDSGHSVRLVEMITGRPVVHNGLPQAMMLLWETKGKLGVTYHSVDGCEVLLLFPTAVDHWASSNSLSLAVGSSANVDRLSSQR